MTNDDNLIRMANQIGTFFESMPDRNEAYEGIAQHLKKFWDPRMRQQFLLVVDADADTAALKPIVRDAVLAHRSLLG